MRPSKTLFYSLMALCALMTGPVLRGSSVLVLNGGGNSGGTIISSTYTPHVVTGATLDATRAGTQNVSPTTSNGELSLTTSQNPYNGLTLTNFTGVLTLSSSYSSSAPFPWITSGSLSPGPLMVDRLNGTTLYISGTTANQATNTLSLAGSSLMLYGPGYTTGTSGGGAASNLTPCQPPGWSDKIVVSNALGTNVDSSYLTTGPLYVNWAVQNSGTSDIPGAFQTQLYVDEVLVGTWNTPLLAANKDQFTYAFLPNYSLGSLASGTHTLRIRTDSGGAISETDETDNEYTKIITVHQPGQYAALDVQAHPYGSGTVSGGGPVPVDSMQKITAAPADGWIFAGWADGNTDNPRTVSVPAAGVDYTATFVSTSAPDIAPVQPEGWSDKIVVSSGTGSKLDSGTFHSSDTLYVNWALVNSGTNATAAGFTTQICVDGTVCDSWNTASLPSGYLTGWEDYSIGSLSPGTHTITIKTDTGDNVEELDESNNVYTKTISVGPPAYTLSASAGTHGTVSPGTIAEIAPGGSASFTATPDAGYVVSQWIVSGTLSQTGGSGFTRNGVNANATVQVVFKPLGTGLDLNGDGSDDILWQNGSVVSAWIMSGTTRTSNSVLTSNSGGYQVKAAGDLNGDGRTDIIWQNGNTVVAWLMNGTGQFTPAVLNSSTGYQVVAAGDIDGDGKTDIILQKGNTVVAWLMDGTKVKSAVVLCANAGGYQVKAMADLDGDGKLDLVWQAGNTVAVWFMNGLKVQSVSAVPANAVGYTVTGVADLNGDGKTDLLLQKGASAIAWLMNGNKVQSVVPLTTNAGGYRIAGPQ